MKFFTVSDIHSYLTPLKRALDDAGFDKDNPNHWFICCGDAFDRGDESEELLHYLMSLERKTLVKGNHDILLEECCMREFPYSYDFSNRTAKTINDIGGAGEGYAFDRCCENTWNRTAVYRALLVNYFETENYIFVHSWIPLNELFERAEYDPDWRNANNGLWERAMWGNPFEFAEQGLNKTGKTIVFGHWHCSRGWAKLEKRSEFAADAKWEPYINTDQKVIGLDTCTAHTGKVNVLVLEDEFLND